MYDPSRISCLGNGLHQGVFVRTQVSNGCSARCEVDVGLDHVRQGQERSLDSRNARRTAHLRHSQHILPRTDIVAKPADRLGEPFGTHSLGIVPNGGRIRREVDGCVHYAGDLSKSLLDACGTRCTGHARDGQGNVMCVAWGRFRHQMGTSSRVCRYGTGTTI